jgi:uncharacterized membrane protein YbaN (DUF454 family)
MQPPPPPPSSPARPLSAPLSQVVRWVYLGLALFFLLLGVIGALVPVLPTTPFILLAAWAAARSSPRLLDWLENHTAFGPMISDWRRGGVVGRRAKWFATLAMSVSAAYLLYGVRPLWVPLLAMACMTATLLWLWRRPEQFPIDAGPPRD